MAYDDTFPMDFPLSDDNSAQVGQGLGMQLSGMQPWQMVYDPFQFQRPQYMERLAKLASDPSSVTSTPWFNTGIEAVKRGMSKGYLDSGNMALALSSYGQDQYYKQLSMLAGLAGAGMGPTNVGGAMVGARGAGAELQSKALGTQRYQDLQRFLQEARGPRSSLGSNNFGGVKKPLGPGQTYANRPAPGATGTGRGPGAGPTTDDYGWEQLRDDFGLDPSLTEDEVYQQIFGGDDQYPGAAGDMFGNADDYWSSSSEFGNTTYETPPGDNLKWYGSGNSFNDEMGFMDYWMGE